MKGKKQVVRFKGGEPYITFDVLHAE
jgi:hypothetical protein